MSRPFAIGVDVGGTKIAAGLLDVATGEAGARRTVPTRVENGGSGALDDTVALARALAVEAPGPIAAIGVGVPELVDPAGRTVSAQTLAWGDLPVAARLGEIAPVTIEADVRAAALAEARLGAGRTFADFAYVSVGTGVSSTLVIGGRPYAGVRGGALVLATGPVTVPCPRCGASISFVLEDYASGRAIAARYSAATGMLASGADVVVAAAGTDDAAARKIVTSAAEALGSAIGWLVNVADPAAVVVGGGLGSAPGLFWDCLVAATRRHVWNDAARSLPILHAQLGPDAGWIGAAIAGMERRDQQVIADGHLHTNL
jgi:glucokinase